MADRIVSRAFHDEDDWWRVRALLLDVFPRVPAGSAWEVRRWDGRRFHRADPWDEAILSRCRLWETGGGRLVGAAFSEGSFPDVHLLVEPEHRALEGEMLDWGIEALTAEREGARRLFHTVFEDDRDRIALVEERGFSRTEDREAVQRQDLSGPIPDPLPPAEGYMLRETSDDPDDHARMADLLNAGFGRDIHSAAEYASFTAVSPSFRHDLNLVAVGPDGTFAAHAGFTYDEANRFGILEPVCTRPDHRRRGLALSLIREGIRRVRRLGAVAATVDTGADEGPNRLYEAAGFVRARWGHVWHRAEGGG